MDVSASAPCFAGVVLAVSVVEDNYRTAAPAAPPPACADEAGLLSRLQHGQSLRQFVHQPQLHLSQGEGVRLQRERTRNIESQLTIERHRARGHRGPGERLG